MPPIILLFRDILLLRRGPQDVPYSPRLLAAVAALDVLAQLPLSLFREVSASAVLFAGAVAVLFTLVVLHLLLSLRGLASRFVQMATAFLGCGIFFDALTLPIALLAGTPPATIEQMTPSQQLAGAMWLPVLIWKIAVEAHLFRHGLNVRFLTGLGIALLWFVLLLIGGVQAR